MAKIHIIRHTHWDSEWFFTREDARTLFPHTFNGILKNVKKFKNSFLLDGQVSILDDVLLNPKIKKEIISLSQKELLPLGPWISQPDMRSSSFESLVRNYELGSETVKNIGGKLFNIGYTPDTFGFNENIPNVYKALGVDSAIVWRGVDREKVGNSPVFNWEAPDGHKVFTYNIASGYFVGRFMPSGEDELKSFYNTNIKPSINYQTMNGKIPVMAFPSGGDQRPWNDNLIEACKKINEFDSENEYVISDWETFLKEIKNLVNGKEIPTYKGQMTKAYGGRLHKTIISQRQDIKEKFYKLENLLETVVEPLSVMMEKQGWEYSKVSIDEAWRLLTLSQAHDSYGGCNSDEVNEKISNRLDKALNLVNAQIDLCKRVIAENENKDMLLVINPTDTNDYIWVKAKIATLTKNFKMTLGKKNIPYIIEKQEEVYGGKKVIYTAKGEVELDKPNVMVTNLLFSTKIDKFSVQKINVKETKDSFNEANKKSEYIENNFYKIIINKSKLNLLCVNDLKKIEDFIYFEHHNDFGDSYDWSPKSLHEKPTHLKITNLKIKRVHKTDEWEVMTIEGVLNKTKVEINFKLFRNSSNLEIHINVLKNQFIDSRLRVVFKTSNNSAMHKAFVANAIVERNNYINGSNWKKQKLREFPLSIDVHHGVLAIGDFYLSTNTNKEYEFSKDGSKMHLTLLRTPSFLGKENLAIRPGRASGLSDKIVLTPDAHMIGKNINHKFIINYIGGSMSNSLYSKKQLSLDDLCFHKQTNYAYIGRMERFQFNIPKIENKGMGLNLPAGLHCVALYKLGPKTKIRLLNISKEKINKKIILGNKSFLINLDINELGVYEI